MCVFQYYIQSLKNFRGMCNNVNQSNFAPTPISSITNGMSFGVTSYSNAYT